MATSDKRAKQISPDVEESGRYHTENVGRRLPRELGFRSMQMGMASWAMEGLEGEECHQKNPNNSMKGRSRSRREYEENMTTWLRMKTSVPEGLALPNVDFANL
jgi:hypothetical protein